ncbi:hypothetical protein EJ04DRAFT_507970, partial [Polyplosphaeria fusca]
MTLCCQRSVFTGAQPAATGRCWVLGVAVRLAAPHLGTGPVIHCTANVVTPPGDTSSRAAGSSTGRCRLRIDGCAIRT